MDELARSFARVIRWTKLTKHIGNGHWILGTDMAETETLASCSPICPFATSYASMVQPQYA